MEILIGIVCFGLLVAILFHLFKSTDRIKALEWRLGQLERKFRETKQTERPEPVVEPEPTQPSGTAIPVSEATDPPAQDIVISGPAAAKPPLSPVPEVAGTASPHQKENPLSDRKPQLGGIRE